jgi:hypothetical protein
MAPPTPKLNWKVACAFNDVAVVPLVVSALSDVNVRPLVADAVERKLPLAVIAFGAGFVSFGSPFMITKLVLLAECVRSVIVTVIS